MPPSSASTPAKPLSGPQKALQKLGLIRPIDLALHLPLRYEDETRLVQLRDLREGDVAQVEGTVRHCEVKLGGTMQLLVTLDDGTGTCLLRFFTIYPSMQKALAVGKQIRVRGEVRGGFAGLTMMHPAYQSAGGELPSALTPVYPTVAGLPQAYLSKAVQAGLERADLTDTLPAEFLNEIGLQPLWNLREALLFLHHPGPETTLATLTERSHPAWQRLKAEELLAQQISQLQAKRARAARLAPVLMPGFDLAALVDKKAALDQRTSPIASAPEAGRISGIDSQNRPQPGVPDLPVDGPVVAQRAGSKWAAAGVAQPLHDRSDRLLAPLHQRLLAALPFELTAAQHRVCAEIIGDLRRPVPMHRLLQGDVGSGKTVVAALAAVVCIEAGWQCALMAPTEILATQHFAKLVSWLQPLGITTAWLTGSQKARERRDMLALIASGQAQLVVGTHAIIGEKVQFQKLALAIIDEQHRFGVAQRLALRGKLTDAASAPPDDEVPPGAGAASPELGLSKSVDPATTGQLNAPSALEPHLLMMTATPIPRTLAMSYYADLDLSTIDELPPGRTPIITKVVNEARRAEVVERIGLQIAQGRQIYWVCPLIEESEALDLTNATETHAQLSAALPGVMVGLLHSRMPAAEKKAVMSLFTGGQMGLLVSTTVIEVGVDVPNASLMVIEHAERFGLSQLHQLRGRVGRGTAASACVLLYGTGDAPRLGQTARERLRAMAESNDGFEIARRDLEIRGPGEFMGARQSGAALLRFADVVEDATVLAWARKLAPVMLDQYPALAERHVQRWLGTRAEFLKA